MSEFVEVVCPHCAARHEDTFEALNEGCHHLICSQCQTTFEFQVLECRRCAADIVHYGHSAATTVCCPDCGFVQSLDGEALDDDVD